VELPTDDGGTAIPGALVRGVPVFPDEDDGAAELDADDE